MTDLLSTPGSPLYLTSTCELLFDSTKVGLPNDVGFIRTVMMMKYALVNPDDYIMFSNT